MLETYGAPATVRSTGGRYFGFVNGGVLPVAAASRWMSDVWDQNCALHAMSPVSSKLEQVVEGWMADLLGLEAGTALGLVGGSSVATLCKQRKQDRQTDRQTFSDPSSSGAELVGSSFGVTHFVYLS